MNDWWSPADAAAVIETYCQARGWEEGSFCHRFRLETPYRGRKGWVNRLRDGEVRVDDIARVMEDMSLTWPVGAEWPTGVRRPNMRERA